MKKLSHWLLSDSFAAIYKLLLNPSKIKIKSSYRYEGLLESISLRLWESITPSDSTHSSAIDATCNSKVSGIHNFIKKKHSNRFKKIISMFAYRKFVTYLSLSVILDFFCQSKPQILRLATHSRLNDIFHLKKKKIQIIQVTFLWVTPRKCTEDIRFI